MADQDFHERPARPGELCTCGHPAVIVYEGGILGPVGYCGVPGRRPQLPCPFCGSEGGHEGARCDLYEVDKRRPNKGACLCTPDVCHDDDVDSPTPCPVCVNLDPEQPCPADPC